LDVKYELCGAKILDSSNILTENEIKKVKRDFNFEEILKS